MTYLLLAVAVTIVVIGLAWRGLGTGDNGGGTTVEPKPRPRPTRPVAPDDDPDFLGEIDRRLRGEEKNGRGDDKSV